MLSVALPVHAELAEHSRFRPTGSLLSREAVALGILIFFGALAAVATVCIDLKLRLPGSAILRAVFPMAFGLALAPRRRGGTAMAMSAVSTALLLQVAGFKLGSGSLTSLALIGPCLDVTLHRAQGGWRLYGSFILAGLVCNLGALTVRAATKFGGWDALTTRPFASWWTQAVGSYVACGIVAGLISAIIWFRWSAKSSSNAVEHGSGP